MRQFKAMQMNMDMMNSMSCAVYPHAPKTESGFHLYGL